VARMDTYMHKSTEGAPEFFIGKKELPFQPTKATSRVLSKQEILRKTTVYQTMR